MSISKLETESLFLRSNVVVSVLQDGAVLLDLDTKYFYSVNASGWAIIQVFENGSTINQVRDKCSAWGATPEDHKYVDLFVERLVKDNLIEQRPSHQNIEEMTSSNITFNGDWSSPTLEKHKEPLQRIMTSAFDPSIPLAE